MYSGAQPGQPGGWSSGGHGGAYPAMPAKPTPVFNSGVCKITSAVDGNVLDAEAGAKKGSGTKVITWHYEGSQNQKWNIQVEGSAYRITSMVRGKKDMLLAIDDATVNPKNKDIIIYDFHGQENQQWAPIPVQTFGGSEFVLIKNIRTGKCLRNMGHGHGVSTFPESHDDKSQWWKIVTI